MIYFFADDHYGTHPGKVLYEHLPAELKSRICFQENDWSVLESGSWRKDCELLILNLRERFYTNISAEAEFLFFSGFSVVIFSRCLGVLP